MTSTAGTAIADADAFQALAYALQLCLGGVFLASVVPKFRHPRRFRQVIARYQLLPQRVVPWITGLVIAGEGALVLSFIGGSSIAVGLATALVLVSAFTVATVHSLRRGREIDCGCFGGVDEKISARTLVRLCFLSAALLGLAVLIGSGQATAQTPVWWLDHGAGITDTVEALAIGIGLTLITAWILEIKTLRSVLRSPAPGLDAVSRQAAQEA